MRLDSKDQEWWGSWGGDVPSPPDRVWGALFVGVRAATAKFLWGSGPPDPHVIGAYAPSMTVGSIRSKVEKLLWKTRCKNKFTFFIQGTFLRF